jgi:transposase
MTQFIVTEEDMQRYRLFHEVKEKKLKLIQSAMILKISYRQAKRLFRAFKKNGFDGLIKKYPKIRNKRKFSDHHIEKILYVRQTLYKKLNILHFKEKLAEDLNIQIGYETLRQLLIQKELHFVKKRAKIYRRRRRMPKAGLLVQMDSSQHHWLPQIHEKWWLIAMIDDATNEVPWALFAPADTSYDNMAVIRKFIEKKGLFEALYVDKASQFLTTRKDGLHQNINPDQENTNIQKALADLGINIIFANSPQAKGRIERLFRFLQDRLINEMKLRKIKNYKEANEFLQEIFLPWYNKRYTHPAESAYRALPKDVDLDSIFTIRFTRKVNKDNTISFNNEIIQLPPSQLTLSYIKAKVEVRIKENQNVYLFYKNKKVMQTVLKKKFIYNEANDRERYLSQRIIA